MNTKTDTEEKNLGEFEVMFNAGAHYAFSKSRRHPSVKPYIFGAKNRVEIFDLEKTVQKLKEAKDYISGVAKEGKVVLFIGGKSEAKAAIKKAAESLGMPYVNGRWKGGTLTNFSEIKKRIDKLEELTSKREKGELEKYTKKERLMIDREIDGLEKSFSGLVSMKSIPDAVFVVDPRSEHTAVDEARSLNIPVVALAGSDCNLDQIDYPIPGNDSTLASIKFFVQEIASAFKPEKKSS
jgi:small subunit ribosomal protein S2